MFSSVTSYAWSESADQPSVKCSKAFAVLKKVIEADFVASDGGGERLDNVIYSSSAKRREDDGTKPGFYTLNWDAFDVAKKWRLLNEKAIDDGLCEFSIEFKLRGRVATDGGENIIPDIRSLVVTYRVKITAQGWKVVDPPKPVVGIDSLEMFYLAEKERFSGKIKAMRGRGKEPYQNLLNGLELANRRLGDIKKLKR